MLQRLRHQRDIWLCLCLCTGLCVLDCYITGGFDQEVAIRLVIAMGICVVAYLFGKRSQKREPTRVDLQTRLATLENAMGDAMFISDSSGKFVEVNQRACESLGYSRSELLCLTVPDVDVNFSLQDIETFMASMVPDEFLTLEGIHRRKDGSEFPVEVRVGMLSLADEKFFLALARDVTIRKELEIQLLQSQKMEALGRLSGGIAHDFNNLLSAILGYCELANRRITDTQAREKIGKIIDTADRAASLTHQLLLFSRRQKVRPQVLNIYEAIDKLHDILHRLIGEDIELQITANGGIRQILVDKGQLEQVIINLVVNARDAMPRGGKLQLSIRELRIEKPKIVASGKIDPGDYVTLAISDTGCGIDPKNIQNIFDPFFTTKEKGTGLGLSTVFGIVRQHKGAIDVTSLTGQGTTFTLYFSAVVEKVEEPKEKLSTPKPAAGETILLVEDEDSVRDLTGEILEVGGYHLLAARDGEEALEICEQHDGPIHLLLTDIVMPRLNGKDLVDLMLPRYPGIKILFMSGYTPDALLRYGISEDISLLWKPFKADGLLLKVREVLTK